MKPMSRNLIAILSLLFASLLPGLPLMAQTAAASTIVLTGTAGEKATVTAAELATLPRTTVTVYDAHTKTQETYSGVLLSDLLARVNAPLGDKLHGKALGIRVVAEGSDHYSALYSLAEVDPEFHPGTVIIADTMDGKGLPPGHGPLQIINTEDKRPARWVRELIAIRLVAGE
jgi:hypothetical protein